MMELPTKGRARARARGRARYSQQQQPGMHDRPGGLQHQWGLLQQQLQSAQQQGQPPQQQPPPQQLPPPCFQQPQQPSQLQAYSHLSGGLQQPASFGRAHHRTRAIRSDQQPGEGGAAGLVAGMQWMDIGGGGDNGGKGHVVGRGMYHCRRQLNVKEVHTQPEQVSSKKGIAGNKVMLTANYYQLQTHTDWHLYQYKVDFIPDEDSTAVRKALLHTHKKTLGGYLFDGTMMFTSHMLTTDAAKTLVLESQHVSDGTKVVITVRQVGDLAMGDHHYVQFFNILMRKCLGHLNLQLVGRNFFDPQAMVEVQEFKLELWPGYLISIRQHENNILMCSEITHKVMRQDNVLNLLADCVHRDHRDYQRMFQKAIIGTVVLTDYNNRTYRVDDVDFSVSPKSTFKLRNGTDISYMQYYLEKYQIKIASVNQPMLISRTKARERRGGMSKMVYLVPELCLMTGLTDEMRSNFQLMRTLAQHTRVGPHSRIQKLQQFVHRLLQEKAIVDDLKEWNMKLDNKLVEFEGRVLPSEKIVQGGEGAFEYSRYDPGQPSDWTRELHSKPLLCLPQLVSWVVICPGRYKRDGQGFVITLIRAASGMRFVIPQPYFHEIQDDRAGTYVDALEKVICSMNPQFVMCIVSNNQANRYSAIKMKCCVKRAVPTQVILSKNLTSKSVISIATKVAIQINCKIGGAPWTVEVPLNGLMVVGFDVCHDTRFKGKSYCAMVASLDKPCTRYFSAVSAHTTGQELSNDLSANMCKAIRKYMDYNEGQLPQRIIVYRDDVGEGQIPYVFSHEVQMLRGKLQSMYGSTSVRMAFILVSKRINTRIFLKNSNPPPGTIVDDCITMPERYDFFLVSQSVRQGTVSPTSYNVISDNVGLDPDKVQRLTYKLTHLYYNWSGTLRVPAPCQYAHKLAYFVSHALHCPPSTELEDLLYFL